MKTFLLKDILQIGQKKFLLLTKLKILIQNTGTYVISDVNGEDISGSFSEKELQKTTQKEFRIEKVIGRKGDKLYGYDNRFNSRVDKKDLVASNV